MVGGRRYSFDEALSRRLKELEATLENYHDAIAAEAQRWLADIERAAVEQLVALEACAADKTTELQRVAAEQRRALDEAAGARSAEVPSAAGPGGVPPAPGEPTGDRIEGLREAVRVQMALLQELTSLHAAASELEHARAVTVDALRRSIETFGRDVLAALDQVGAADRSPAAPAPRRGGGDAGAPPLHWSAPVDGPR